MWLLGIMIVLVSGSIAQESSNVSLELAPESTTEFAPESTTESQEPTTSLEQASASLQASPPSQGINAQASNSTPALQGAAGSTGATMTLEVPSSMFSPSSTAGQPAPTSSSQPAISLSGLQNLLNQLLNRTQQGAQPTQNECANLDWEPDVQTGCTTKECIETSVADLEKLFKCLESKPANVSDFGLVTLVMGYGKRLAELYRINPKNVNESGIVFNDHFAFSGVPLDAFINDTTMRYLNLPNYSDPDHFTGKWQQWRDEIKIPLAAVRAKGVYHVSAVWSVFSDLVKVVPLMLHEIQTDYNAMIAESDLNELYVDNMGNLITTKKYPDRVINSALFSLTFYPYLDELSHPLLITLRHKKVEDYEQPRCVYWDTMKSQFRSDGCEVHETNSTHTVCACTKGSNFAVAMKAKMIVDSSDREAVVTVALVLNTISLVALLICAIAIIVIGYYHVDNMRIALNLDMALLLSHVVFYIGIPSSSAHYHSDPATCEVISILVHLFQLAALTWLLMEGLHYVSKFKKIFNPENAQPWFIYCAVGWGVPIAFAAACAGYTYPHFGTPKINEFCWPSIRGTQAWYFGAPMLILAILNLMVRAVVLKEVVTWKGDPDDIDIERTRHRLVSFIILLPFVILTWLFGVLSTNYSEDKVYHYLFIVFYTLQGILVAVFYCAKNNELWDFHRERKEAKLKEKNAVFHFQYIP